MPINQPCAPRCNAKIYIPKLTEEERRRGDGPALGCLPVAQKTRYGMIHVLLASRVRCVGLSQWMRRMTPMRKTPQ